MPTRIRLQRHGKKNKPFYSVVVADGRAPRNGRFIEKIGTYNPMTDPASINLDFDRAIYWLECGAQPSDTTRSLLSREGVMLKRHLLGGVKKGAFTLEQAEEKFQAWKTQKELELNSYKNNKVQKTKAEIKKAFEAETIAKDAKAAIVAKKRQPEAAPKAVETVEDVVEIVTETPVEAIEEVAPVEVAVEEVAETVAEVEATTEETTEETSEKAAE